MTLLSSFSLVWVFFEFFLTQFEALRYRASLCTDYEAHRGSFFPFIIKIVLFRSKTWQTIWFYSMWFSLLLLMNTQQEKTGWTVFSVKAYSHTSLYFCALCRSRGWSGWCPCTTTIWTAFWLMKWVSAKPSKPSLSLPTWWSTRGSTAPSSSSFLFR